MHKGKQYQIEMISAFLRGLIERMKREETGIYKDWIWLSLGISRASILELHSWREVNARTQQMFQKKASLDKELYCWLTSG